MLTEAEKKWLEGREENLEIFGGYFCPNCPELVLEEGIMYCGRGGGEHCIDNPHKYAFKDAAEFEARVAVKLATGFCPSYCDNLDANDCAVSDCALCTKRSACRLKHARLAVEEKMEEEGRT